jgi:hypothetical protein
VSRYSQLRLVTSFASWQQLHPVVEPSPSGLQAKRYGVSTETYISMITKCASLLAVMATR